MRDKKRANRCEILLLSAVASSVCVHFRNHMNPYRRLFLLRLFFVFSIVLFFFITGCVLVSDCQSYVLATAALVNGKGEILTPHKSATLN